jgi:hypothetical protein
MVPSRSNAKEVSGTPSVHVEESDYLKAPIERLSLSDELPLNFDLPGGLCFTRKGVSASPPETTLQELDMEASNSSFEIPEDLRFDTKGYHSPPKLVQTTLKDLVNVEALQSSFNIPEALRFDREGLSSLSPRLAEMNFKRADMGASTSPFDVPEDLHFPWRGLSSPVVETNLNMQASNSLFHVPEDLCFEKGVPMSSPKLTKMNSRELNMEVSNSSFSVPQGLCFERGTPLAWTLEPAEADIREIDAPIEVPDDLHLDEDTLSSATRLVGRRALDQEIVAGSLNIDERGPNPLLDNVHLPERKNLSPVLPVSISSTLNQFGNPPAPAESKPEAGPGRSLPSGLTFVKKGKTRLLAYDDKPLELDTRLRKTSEFPRKVKESLDTVSCKRYY